MSQVNIREFIFQKCFAEEIIYALNKCMTLICDGCNERSEIHICLPNNYLTYYNLAKYFVNTNNIYINVNIKLAKYDLEEVSRSEITEMFLKVENEWSPIIHALISIIDL